MFSNKCFVLVIWASLCACGKLSAVGTSSTSSLPSVSIANASTAQGSNLIFPVTLSAVSSQDVTINFQINPGTAAAGVQYTDTSGTATIPHGLLSTTISVPTLEDGIDKVSSSFSITLNSATHASVASATATGTINDATLLFNFMVPTLSSSLQFSRSSTAFVYNSSGILTSVAADTPRFSYDPTTHALRGLLIERNSSNQVFYSEDFSQSNWAKTSSTVVANSVTTPTLSTNSLDLTESNSSAVHSLSQVGLSYTAVHPITASIFAKAGARTKLRLRVSDGTNGFYYDCDLSATVTITTSSVPAVEGSVLASGTSGSLSTLKTAGVAGGAGTIDAGSGWRRCWVSGVMPTSDVGTNNVLMKVSIVNGSSESYLGDGTSSLTLWGAQYEEYLSIPTSYIPTAATSGISRSADILTVAPLGSWYSAGDFTANVSYMRRWFEKPYDPNLGVSTYPTAFLFYNAGSLSNRFGPQYSSDGTNILFNWFTGSSFVTGANTAANQNVQGQTYKVGVKRSASAISIAVGGSAPSVASGSVTSNSVDTLGLGNTSANGDGLNGYLQRFSYRPRAVPDTQFSALTQ